MALVDNDNDLLFIDTRFVNKALHSEASSLPSYLGKLYALRDKGILFRSLENIVCGHASAIDMQRVARLTDASDFRDIECLYLRLKEDLQIA